MTQRHVPGLAVVALKEGKVLKVATYGVAVRDPAAPVTADTVFRINSMTKSFTAMAVMMLVEDGKVGLDDPIARHLTGSPPAWQPITVRHLLGHTSGLKDFLNDALLDFERETTDQEILGAVAAQPLKFAPGESWDYSNTNYHLLAMIIEHASGRWYGDFLAERIFRPLDMTRTAVVRDDETLPGRARGYYLENGQLRDGAVLPWSIASNGAGGLWSTANDLAKWDAALESDRLVSRATLQAMWTPVQLNSGATVVHGFGWEIDAIAGHRRVSHTGRWLGFASHIDRFVDDRLTVIVLTNLFDANVGRLSRAVAGLYIPSVAPPRFEPIEDHEPAVTRRFVDVLRRAAAGRLRPDDFAASTWPYVEPIAAQMSRDFSKFGHLEGLTLVERTEVDENRSYRYQARFSRTSMVFHFLLNEDGRIVLMMPER